MTTIVLTPPAPGRAIELGSQLWRKRVLPVGDVAYKGRMLHFTPGYLAELASAFARRAYDQVPFQLATDANSHTNDPERTRGQVIDMEAGPDGLWITAKVTPDGERVLAANPGLGVSARIVEDYARSDGTHFPAAIQHVLGTLDPRIPGLGGWQAIETASVPGETPVIDLSSADWDGVDISPAEIAAVDQAVAEADEEAFLDQIVADAHAEAEAERQARYEQSLADPGLREIAQEMAACLAENGEEAEAGLLLSEMGLPGVELASGQYRDVLDLANAQIDRDVTRARQDAEPVPRSAGTEDRLARAYGRIAAGTYTPAPGAATEFEFAGPSSAASRLARHRWHGQRPSPVTGAGNCGSSDEFGYCMEPRHAMGCGSVADPFTAAELREVMQAGAARPFIDAAGRVARPGNRQPDDPH
jgi:hypothetical protein